MLRIAEDYIVEKSAGRLIKPGDLYEDGAKSKKARMKGEKQGGGSAGEKLLETEAPLAEGESNPKTA